MAVILTKWRGEAFKDLTERRIGIALRITGAKMQREVIQSISTRGKRIRGTQVRRSKKTGRKLKSRLTKKRTTSKPGEPPFVVTARLKGSIAFQVIGNVLRVGSNVEYARALELRNPKGNLKARPYLRPVLDSSGPIIEAAIRSAAKR